MACIRRHSSDGPKRATGLQCETEKGNAQRSRRSLGFTQYGQTRKMGGAPGLGPVQSYGLVLCTAQPGLAAYWGGLIPMLAGAYVGGEFAQLGGQLTEIHTTVDVKQRFHQGVTFDFLLKNILNGLSNSPLHV